MRGGLPSCDYSQCVPLYWGSEEASNGRPLATNHIIKEHTVIIANHKLNTLDALFIIADRIERYDYVAVGERIIRTAATLAAIIIGVASYVITALQLFWLQHGESVMAGAFKLIINIVDYTHELYQFGAETRRFIVKLTSYTADKAFYTITALI